jgi:hypothetical protein
MLRFPIGHSPDESWKDLKDVPETPKDPVPNVVCRSSEQGGLNTVIREAVGPGAEVSALHAATEFNT